MRAVKNFDSLLTVGRNFGDEGLVFLAESLGYNQVWLFFQKFMRIDANFPLLTNSINMGFSVC